MRSPTRAPVSPSLLVGMDTPQLTPALVVAVAEGLGACRRGDRAGT